MTIVENGEGILDKEATLHENLLDGFRLMLRSYTRLCYATKAEASYYPLIL